MVDLKVGDLIKYKSQKGDGSRDLSDPEDYIQTVEVLRLAPAAMERGVTGLLFWEADFVGLTKNGPMNLSRDGYLHHIESKAANWLKIKTKI